MQSFDASGFLPDGVLAQLTELRVADPDRPLRITRRRRRRTKPTTDGRLNVLAADHPARRVTQVQADPLAMADRHDYLARTVRVLTGATVDGVMTTMDVLEDLLLLDGLLQEAGGPSLLNNKLLIASLNRGGLAGTSWEMDDPMTGPAPETCVSWGLDGAKVLLRICDDDPSSLKTMVAAAGAIRALNSLGLPTFVEPLPVARTETGYGVVRDAGLLARTVGVASALGDSSRYLWLKLPYTDGFESVARATTLPILLLGGEATGEPTPFLREVEAGLAAHANVRGAMVGRNVLYPGSEDPLAVAEAIGGLVHEGWTAEQAQAAIGERRGQDMDAITRWLP